MAFIEHQNSNLKERWIQTGYVLGISLILAAIIYFFASNWPGIGRHMKLGLSIGLVVMFYGLSLLLSKWLVYRGFLSEMTMFSGSIAFGVSLALVGQIYNSHADSFILFIIWAIPTLLFSLITTYQPFYILTYILIHLSVWFYVFPSTGLVFSHIDIFRLFIISTALANFLLFWSLEKAFFKSHSLKWLSFSIFHIALVVLSTGDWSDFFTVMMSIIYVVILILWFLYYIKSKASQSLAIFLGVACTVFLLIKFFSFLSYIGTENVYYFTIFIPVILIVASLMIIRKTRDSLAFGHHKLLKQIFGGIVIAVSSVITTSSILGILYGIIGDVSYTIPFLLALILITLGLFLTSWHQLIRYTLLLTGFLIGGPSSIANNSLSAFILIGVIVFVFWRINHRWFQYISYLATMLLITALCVKNDIPRNDIVFLLVMLNGIIFFVRHKLSIQLQEILLNNSFIYGMLAFFVWTFFHQEQAIIYFLINGMFFLLTTVVLYLSLNQNPLLFRVTIILWFAYIVYKYYDTLWSLLNKSVTFTLLGVFILILTFRFDTRHGGFDEKVSFIHKKWRSILLILLLQLAIITFQVGKNDYLLSHGTTIKLEVAPVDPRSFIQGDYLNLHYHISSITIKPKPYNNQKISIALVKSKDGFYTYAGHYSIGHPPTDKKGFIWINGRYRGDSRVVYGFENYFIPETSGLNQSQIHVAYVKVSENGNAILISVK